MGTNVWINEGIIKMPLLITKEEFEKRKKKAGT